MTDKLLHPELGSGALREALERMYKKAVLRGWQCAADAECRAAMDQSRTALSLSSPIEPNTEQSCENEQGTDWIAARRGEAKGGV